MSRRGRRVAMWAGAVGVLVLSLATWLSWPHLRFWWLFKPLGKNAQGYPEYRHRQTGIVFVRVPGGTFSMGSPEGEPDRDEDDEGPLHDVTLSPFLIGKFELTQSEWHAVMGSYPSYFDGTKDADGNLVNPPDNRDRLPVEQVSWEDVHEFEAKTGLTLPTEAQWEYACRGGTVTAFSFGSGESCADWFSAACPERDPYMWYCANSGNRPHEVGTKKANPFGLHDLHGNVFEWVEDKYSEDFYSTPDATRQDPICATGYVIRGVRGGCWADFAGDCRSAYRRSFFHRDRFRRLGFRPAAPCP